MKVVGHDAVRRQPHVWRRDRFGLDPLESFEATVVVEVGESGLGADQEGIDEPAFRGARGSAHDSRVARRATDAKNYGFRVFFRSGQAGFVEPQGWIERFSTSTILPLFRAFLAQ